ncbi:hypothetical protein H6P81_007787 [Aristolochia fimbriata]|uniref:Uncharacterized protein n=1 Tax=Aristolochia fimbriata TaxID=158543 RepID=A0AAV7F1G2_ARIFI|nr:hypothetical protein H6P81_007787 [Aristolochia fimbriata]
MEGQEDEIICLDESFFINDNYQLTTFSFGSLELQLFCLQSASTDYDLTGQLVWPGAELLNNYISGNTHVLQGCSVIELGSGVGVTGILCSKFCREVLMTDHNNEVLKILRKNIELHSSSETSSSAIVAAENFQHSNIPPLFDTVKQLLQVGGSGCRFLLSYVSRAKIMDVMVIDEAVKHGMKVSEVKGTRSEVGNLQAGGCLLCDPPQYPQDCNSSQEGPHNVVSVDPCITNLVKTILKS